MKLPRRRQFLHLAAGATALPIMPWIAQAQVYPTRAVRIVVPFPAGGNSDILARLIGQWLSERLAQPFVIENRPGASTNIGTEAVIRGPTDGYSLLLLGTNNVLNASLYKKLTFDFARDIAPIAFVARTPYVLVVNPSLPATTVPEFIAYAKSNRGKIAYASSGTGTLSHIFGELFKVMASVDMLHVPYRGNAPAITDLLGGQVQVYFVPVSASVEYIKAGSVRALAVTTTERFSTLPDVPTLATFVPGFEASLWNGFGARTGTPSEIIEKLNREINAGLADPAIKARLLDLGSSVDLGSPMDLRKLIADETEKWGKVIRAANITAE
jgi:tripartite-type tricarboxylate transporter receptor subunit TctC